MRCPKQAQVSTHAAGRNAGRPSTVRATGAMKAGLACCSTRGGPAAAAGSGEQEAQCAHLGAQRDLHSISQLLNACQQAGTAVVAKAQVLGGIATGLQRLVGLQAGAAAKRQRRQK